MTKQNPTATCLVGARQRVRLMAVGVLAVLLLATGGCVTNESPSSPAGPAEPLKLAATQQEREKPVAASEQAIAKPHQSPTSVALAPIPASLEVEPRQTTFPANGEANFYSETGCFEVFFPEEPVRKVRSRQKTAGEFFSLKQGETRFVAGYFTHPYKGMDALIMNRSISKVRNKVGGKVSEKRNIHFLGNSGKEFLILGGERIVQGRYYSFGQTMYLTRYSAPVAEFDPEKAANFLNSFNYRLTCTAQSATSE